MPTYRWRSVMLGESVSSRTRPGRVSVLAGRVGESICQAQAPHRLLVRQSLVVENHGVLGVLYHFPHGVEGSLQAFAAGSDEPTAAGCLLLWAKGPPLPEPRSWERAAAPPPEMFGAVPIDGLSDAEASPESSSDDGSDSEGKPDRPLVVMAREENQQDSGLLSQASRYMILSFFGQQLGLVRLGAKYDDLIFSIERTAQLLVHTCLPLMSVGMVQRRLELVERGFGQPLGAAMVAKTKWGVLSVMLAIDMYMSYSMFTDIKLLGKARRWHDGVIAEQLLWVSRAFYSMLAVTNLVVAIIVLVGLERVWAAAEPGRLRAGSYAQAEAIWSRALLRQLCVALVLPCLISTALYLAEAFYVYEQLTGASLAYAILSVSDQILLPPSESMCLFFICGFFQPERPELCLKKQNSTCNTSRSQILDADASSPGGQQSSTSAWNQTVQSLSGRSLEVEELLEFFGRLGPRQDASGTGPVMPSYDPWRSTTNDVVRGAIIPFSRAGNCGLAYAHCLPGSRASTSTTLPDCMVSHTWSALFLDLVAAVVADALELDEYWKVARRLAEPGGVQKLLQEVQRKICQRYWICAFCVNQHAGICNGFGSEPSPGSDQHSRWDAGRHDTVSGGVFGLFSCSEPKYFDGPKCEMNKFDGMMQLLQRRQPDLRHLVAVDRRFELFGRAWCVAELVQSYLSNLPQTVLLPSNRALDVQAEDLETYNWLATLTVLECKASREEDRLQILAKIPDVHEFDVQLQAVIFGNALVGFDRVDAAARAARRAASAAAASGGR
ncbi:unnamed protein product [Polarella glacialis]|uniref:Uncharacterized protein n=1 Tax=Polarella glacialis TaxID=89957 RepID=A0A813EAV0_POLGL|nr:unnamed protein product [Polarella glacialis]